MSSGILKVFFHFPWVMLVGSLAFRKMFANEGALGFDGFYNQIQYVANLEFIGNDFGFKNGAQLLLNHSVRFFSVLPFYISWKNSFDWIDPLLIFLYSLPALLTIVGGFKFRYGLIFFVPCIYQSKSIFDRYRYFVFI